MAGLIRCFPLLTIAFSPSMREWELQEGEIMTIASFRGGRHPRKKMLCLGCPRTNGNIIRHVSHTPVFIRLLLFLQ